MRHWVYTPAWRNIISCQKFWQGANVLALNFGKEKMCQKFWHRISCQNSVPKLSALKSWRNSLLKFSAQKTISARRCIDPTNQNWNVRAQNMDKVRFIYSVRNIVQDHSFYNTYWDNWPGLLWNQGVPSLSRRCWKLSSAPSSLLNGSWFSPLRCSSSSCLVVWRDCRKL